MQKFLILLFLGISGFHVNALESCGSSPVCAGDRAFNIKYHYSGATVSGINPSTGLITIRYDDDGQYYTYSTKELTFGNGCVDNFCVGGRAYHVTYHYSGAAIVGVNMQTRLITILFDDGGYYTYSPNELTLESGCTSGFCVGDRVAHIKVNYVLASVVGINSSTRRITIRFDDDGYYTYSPEELTKVL